MTDVQACLDVLRQRGVDLPVHMAIVLGTGLGAVADELTDAVSIPYKDLPGWPAAEVTGHAKRLVIGTWQGARLAVLQGRAHYYEKGDAAAMAVPLETLKAMGVETLLLTNSAGSLRPDWPPGSIVMIGDHINLSGANPLIGYPGDDRFVPLADAYAADLRARMREAARAANLSTLEEGTYMWFSGPSFETPAEVRMAARLGADLVGMSTVPEVILGRRLGLTIAALSMVTNLATGIGDGNPNHAETKHVAAQGSAGMTALLRSFVAASPR